MDKLKSIIIVDLLLTKHIARKMKGLTDGSMLYHSLDGHLCYMKYF
jgi:hypothetical protein